MGQQQILFIILAVCVLGIAASAIMIAHDTGVDYRVAMEKDLKALASLAQEFRARPFEQEGGDGTFIGLTATPQGFQRLASGFNRSYARYYISRSGNSRSVEITALGHFPGNDSRMPMKMVMTVFADSSATLIVN